MKYPVELLELYALLSADTWQPAELYCLYMASECMCEVITVSAAQLSMLSSN